MIANKRSIDCNSLNMRQKHVYDMIIKALILNANESKTGEGNNISRF